MKSIMRHLMITLAVAGLGLSIGTTVPVALVQAACNTTTPACDQLCVEWDKFYYSPGTNNHLSFDMNVARKGTYCTDRSTTGKPINPQTRTIDHHMTATAHCTKDDKSTASAVGVSVSSTTTWTESQCGDGS